MKLHQHDTDGPPCRHMEKILQKTADGSANIFERFYARHHANGCGRCNRFLDRMVETIGRLRGAKADPSAEVLKRLAEGDWRK